ncbi:chemotaxis protein CheZ [Breoghania corrubedonensis]|uniref:Chemotaxis protein CheZ n=1 Tax=Breoghania corrubedonensis TaxID=665038 RepID=A0A2T5VF17_9HYPH|nr:protein phosphatase CheZ [Breoghania corrubedonensis]PTW62342.1 chemotaxis protein CheZ [Breoghania corrubedonensis]
MSRVRKPFRVETTFKSNDVSSGVRDDFMAKERHKELLDQLASLRVLIQPTQQVSETVVEEYKREHAAALKLKHELDEMYEAINRTKHEIATLHHSGFEGEEMKRVTNELDAVVLGTEGATEQILSAAEFIDETASTLARHLTGDDETHAQEIQERVLAIFEACNFQDLTGQRITKVVRTLSFIEERIIRMMEIWGGVDTFKNIEVEEREVREGDATLLNGPALDIDNDVASQDDIDALFS